MALHGPPYSQDLPFGLIGFVGYALQLHSLSSIPQGKGRVLKPSHEPVYLLILFAISAADLFKSLVCILQIHKYHTITFTVVPTPSRKSPNIMYRILSMLAGLLLMLFASEIRPSPIDQRNVFPTVTEKSNVTFPLPARIVYDFPADTWIENLAVRSNGQIIVTEDTRPRIYQVDPFWSRKPILVHEFHETASILGIVETAPDVFHVCTANYSSKKLEGYGDAYIFRVDMRKFLPDRLGSAEITKIATLPQAKALDGMTFLGGQSDLLLVSDFLLGVIFSVNINTGASRVAINNSYTQSTGFGVNGLRFHDGFLYFTNTQHETLVKVAVNSKGEAVGNYTIMAYGGFGPDDIAIDDHGDIYVTSYTQGKNGVAFVPREGGAATYIAGMPGPTSCAFGRTAADWDVLYVSTSGGDYEYLSGKPVTVSGKILKVHVGRRGA